MLFRSRRFNNLFNKISIPPKEIEKRLMSRNFKVYLKTMGRAKKKEK